MQGTVKRLWLGTSVIWLLCLPVVIALFREDPVIAAATAFLLPVPISIGVRLGLQSGEPSRAKVFRERPAISSSATDAVAALHQRNLIFFFGIVMFLATVLGVLLIASSFEGDSNVDFLTVILLGISVFIVLRSLWKMRLVYQIAWVRHRRSTLLSLQEVAKVLSWASVSSALFPTLCGSLLYLTDRDAWRLWIFALSTPILATYQWWHIRNVVLFISREGLLSEKHEQAW